LSPPNYPAVIKPRGFLFAAIEKYLILLYYIINNIITNSQAPIKGCEWSMEKKQITLPGRIATALGILRDAGHKAYIVGGCVRDALMGKEPYDWDIATSAVPDEVMAVFEGYRQVYSGLKHGTVTVVIDGEPVEITTFRIDGEYSDGRRPDSVQFTGSIVTDLARRDFTINACAFGEEGVVDPFGGADDINKRIIRCVGDPESRFREDALRILRGLRFASTLGFDIDKPTGEAMLSCADLLKNVSQERITAELGKILAGAGAEKVLSDFREILIRIIPEIEPTIGFDQRSPYHIYDVFEHTLHSVENIENDPVLRTAMLLHDIGKPVCFHIDGNGRGHFYGHNEVSAQMADEILKRLRYPSQDRKEIVELVRYHNATITPTAAGVKRFLSKHGEAFLQKLLKVRLADALAQNPAYADKNIEMVKRIQALLEEVLERKECFSLHDLAVTGDILISRGIPRGVRLGEILDRLLSLVIEGSLENSEDVLIKEALRLYNLHGDNP